jgi:uncharacterized membrane protein
MAPSAKDREGRTLRVVLGVLAAAGLLISAYLSWVHFAGVAPVCVGGGSGGCETVQSSRYATVLGVPVAVLGIIGYVGLLLSAVMRSDVGVYLGFLFALVGTLFSAYLTYLEVFVIHAICQWCVASAAIMVAALICASLAARRLTASER